MTLAALLTAACGPDAGSRNQCRRAPTFVVTVVADTGALPPDTRLNFEYGSGEESFELARTHTPRVVFCELVPDPNDTPQGGQGGAGDASADVREIVCELWTGGTTELYATATGFVPIAGHPLQPEPDECTVEETVELQTEKPAYD